MACVRRPESHDLELYLGYSTPKDDDEHEGIDLDLYIQLHGSTSDRSGSGRDQHMAWARSSRRCGALEATAVDSEILAKLVRIEGRVSTKRHDG